MGQHASTTGAIPPGSLGPTLTSQDPGVGGYEGLHTEAGASHRPAENRLTPRPWPMSRPPGPGLRAEHGSPRGSADAAVVAALRAGGRTAAVHRRRAAATAFAARSAALYNLTTGWAPTRAGAGPAVPIAARPTCSRRGESPGLGAARGWGGAGVGLSAAGAARRGGPRERRGARVSAPGGVLRFLSLAPAVPLPPPLPR